MTFSYACNKVHYIHCRDGIRESHVVSKTFDVQQVEPDYVNPDEDGMGFMNDIPQTVVRMSQSNIVHSYNFVNITNEQTL